MKPFSSIHFILAPLTALLWAVTATATPLGVGPYTGAGSAANVEVSASAWFLFDGNTLTITLESTTPAHANNVHESPGSTLTGLFFDLTGTPALTPISATVAEGAIIQADKCSSGLCDGATNVDGEWGYQRNSSGFSQTFNDAHEGISSSGYLTTGLSGDIGNFNGGNEGTNLDDPGSLDGINFGIVSASYSSPNGGLKKVPLIQDAVVFILDGVDGLSAANLSNVSFQYGTAWGETNTDGITFIPDDPPATVPAPGALAIIGFGLLLLAGFRFKIRV